MAKMTRGKASKTVMVANYHTAGIVFPRRSPEGISLPPLRLDPGTTTEVDREEWEQRKAIPAVQAYIDSGLIGEVPVMLEDVPVKSASSSNLQIPENLKTDEEALQGEMGSASVKRQKPGEVSI